MSVWAQIDKLKAKYDSEMRLAANGVEGWGGVAGSVVCDEFGHWHCRYIPKGERKHERLHAKSATALVDALKAVREEENERFGGAVRP